VFGDMPLCAKTLNLETKNGKGKKKNINSVIQVSEN